MKKLFLVFISLALFAGNSVAQNVRYRTSSGEPTRRMDYDDPYMYSTPDYTKWYLGVMAGVSAEGIEKIPNTYSLHGAYFFNEKNGAGLVARKYDVFKSEDLFFGAAFFAHWGRSNAKLFFPARIGLGINHHTYYQSKYYQNVNIWGNEYITQNNFGCYGSIGLAIRPSKLISFGINAEFASPFFDIEDNALERLGFNIGVGFHF